jgi:uncharacterized delta-60 repeat protein
MKIEPRSGFLAVFAPAVLLFNLLITQTSQAGFWVTNSPINVQRAFYSATLLPNGKVLIAGGSTGDGRTNAAELYNPATGTWTPTGSLKTSRSGHTATLLPNGKVLVAGGAIGNLASASYLSSAELYDPATETWTPTGAMHAKRSSPSMTLLKTGKVLVAGGYYDDPVTGSTYLDTSELYDPIAGTWSVLTNRLNAGRVWHTATLLPDGKVLIAGGSTSGPIGHLASAELFDPSAETWTETSFLNTARYYHTATLLPNGKVLVVGGDDVIYPHIHYLSSAELYDPLTGTWTQTGSLNEAREFHTATLLPRGQLLIVGGVGNAGFLASAELYDPITGTWTTTNGLAFPRRSHKATLLPGGRVMVTGGVTTNHVYSTEVFDSDNGACTNTQPLSVERYSPTATLLENGKVLLAGGYGVNGVNVSVTNADLFDSSTATWTPASGLNTNRFCHTMTLLPSGWVLVTGGEGIAGTLSSIELYNPVTRIWERRNGMNRPRSYHTATLLRSGRVLVAGGSPTVSGVTAELYEPTGSLWLEAGSMNTARYLHTATLLPDGKVLVAAGISGINDSGITNSAELYEPTTRTWIITGSLNRGRRSHTATLLPNGKVLVAGGRTPGGITNSAELYNPADGTWTVTGSMNHGREGHAAILLPNGKVYVSGGFGSSNLALASAELYDPSTGVWTLTAPLNSPRYNHTATLLPNGQVLLAGGRDDADGTHYLSSVELYDVGLGYSNSWQPQIATVFSPVSFTSNLVVTGTQFRGVSGASGGNHLDSSSDYPLVQLRSIESAQTTFLLCKHFETDLFTSTPLWNFPPGLALVTVFVNGIPSTSAFLSVNVPSPTTITKISPKKLTDGSFQFSFINSPGAIFGAMATTNLALPFTNWTPLGGVVEITPGQFQFTDNSATTNRQRFYGVRAP